MNRKCLSAAQRLRCKNEGENVTEAGMIHVIYLTWLTVITAALTFLLRTDRPSEQSEINEHISSSHFVPGPHDTLRHLV